MQAKANLFRTLLVVPVVLLVAVTVALFGLGLRTAESQEPQACATQTTTPKMQDLGTLGGSRSFARSINDFGQVVGASYTSDGEQHPFLYDSCTQKMQDLGTLGSPWSSDAYGINDSGQVIGYSYTSDNEQKPFLYDESATPKMQDLNDLIPADSGWTIYEAAAINSDGKIAANGHTDTVEAHALLLTPDTTATPATYELQDLGTLGGDEYLYSEATGINDSGQVVGTDATYEGARRAFLYDENATPQMQNLGYYTYPTGINDFGQVAGRSLNFSDDVGWGSRAFLYDESATPQMQNLGTLGGNSSDARGINDSGQVVGDSTIDYYGNSGPRAFLKESGQPMSNLNTLLPADPGWTISYAMAINSDGKIAANGYKDGVGTHALLLTPTNTPPVPPPDTTITSGPTGTVSSRSATFEFSSNESGSTFECSLDGGAWTKCTSPTTYSNLADGNHTFKVRATGGGGADDTPASQSWTIDATAPTVSSVSPTSGAKSVALNTTVTAKFSEAIDPKTLISTPTDPANPNVETSTTFTLVKSGTTTSIKAKVSYDDSTKMVTLTPLSNLDRNTKYTAKMSGEVKDLAGNALAPYSWSFTTSRQ